MEQIRLNLSGVIDDADVSAVKAYIVAHCDARP